MTSLKTDAYRISVMAAGMVGVLAAGLVPASAQQQPPQIPKGWFKACAKQEDVDICESVQRGLGSSSYDQGRYSAKREHGEHHFHKLLAADFRAL